MALVEEPTISTRSGELAWLVDCLAPIFDGLRQPVTVVDPSGRFVYYNRASGLLDGLDPQRALGMHLLQSAPWLAAEQSTLLRCLAEGRPSIDTLQAYVGAGGELLQYRHRAIAAARARRLPARRDGTRRSRRRDRRGRRPGGLPEHPERGAEPAAAVAAPGRFRRHRPAAADPWRDRHRQGTVRPSRPCPEPATQRSDDQPELRSDSRDAGGKYPVRHHPRRFHRRREPQGHVRPGAGRQLVPRRDQFHADGHAEQAAAGPAGRQLPASGQPEPAAGRRTPDRGEQPAAAPGDRRGTPARGPVLPPGRGQPVHPAAARAPRRCGTAGTGVRPSRCAQPQPTCHRPWRTGAGAVAGLRLAGQRPATGKRDPTQPVAARGGRRTAG